MDGEPSRAPAQALAQALQHRLPVERTALALGLAEDPVWRAAIAEERTRAEVRSGTCEVLGEALGPLAPAVAIEGMPWRPLLGTDVDLLVPPRLFAEVRERLVAAGLVEVGWHAGPGRAGLARIGADGALDLVDVESVPEEAFAPTGTGGIGPETATAWAGLRPEAVRDRLCRAVASRSVVRLRDLADADALDLFSAPRPTADPEARGWELLRGAVDGDLPAPPRRDVSGWRRFAARGGLLLRLPGAAERGRSVRIACAGPSAGGRAAELAADLRALAIEVILLDDPGRPAYLRAVLQGMTGDTVVVTAVEAAGQLFPRATLVADPADSRADLLRQALQLLTPVP
jgi:hypothetical protein